jgi:hypothetical protein
VGRQVYVSIYDSSTHAKYLYKAEILHSGRLRAANPAAGGIRFSERRFAFTQGRMFPKLLSPRQPDPNTLNKAHFFVTIQISGMVSKSYEVLEPIKRNLWVEPYQDSALEEFDMELIARFLGYKKSYVVVPIDDERAKSGYRRMDVDIPTLYEQRTLPEKREARDYLLVSKKIIKFNDEDETN